MMSTLIVNCQWDDEMARERPGHPDGGGEDWPPALICLRK